MRMIDGTPVVDADEPVTVHVTSDDCSRGSTKDPRGCAFALALKRIAQCNEGRVHLGCTYLRFGNKWLRYATPPSLKSEIISFDRGGGFFPGNFRLHPMPPALRLKPANPNRNRKRSALRATSQRAGTEKKVTASPRPLHRVEGVRARANGVPKAKA